jgi:putative photosynthetic complex assembly protein 2
MPALPPLWVQLYLFAPFTTILLWGGLTIGLLRLNRRGPRGGKIALALSLPLLLLAHQQLWESRADLSIIGSYRAFGAGLLIWCWHELAFYSGLLTGPWRQPCPPDARGWRRLWYALGTHIYHEIAVAIELVLICTLLSRAGATNWIGPLVIGLSWALQHSAKLNVLLGVRYLQIELFPPHLAFLGSFWAKRAGNRFLLPSLLFTSGLAIWLWAQAATLGLAAGAIGAAMLATLTSLGVLEQLLLMLPAPAQAASAARPTNATSPVERMPL